MSEIAPFIAKADFRHSVFVGKSAPECIGVPGYVEFGAVLIRVDGTESDGRSMDRVPSLTSSSYP